MDEDRVSLKIDLAGGTIELAAPASEFAAALEKTKEFASTLEFSRNRPSLTGSGGQMAGTSGVDARAAAPDQEAPKPAAPPTMRRARAGKASSGRAGRIGSFEAVEGLLSEAQEMELRGFFESKHPTEQSDSILVAMLKGEELLGRKGFSYNEIYTLMWLGGVKELPRALDVVLGRLLQEQMVVREGSGFALKFVGRNYVDRELPKAAS